MKPCRLVQRYQHLGGYFWVTFTVVKYYCLRTATLKMQAADNFEMLVPMCKYITFACPRKVESAVDVFLLVWYLCITLCLFQCFSRQRQMYFCID